MNDITAEETKITADAAKIREYEQAVSCIKDIGIMELKMLISAITRFKYD